VELERFGAGIAPCEAVAVLRDGRVAAGSEGGDIYVIAPDGSPRVLANTGGRALGIAPDRAGNLYVCDPANHAVLRVTPRGEVSPFGAPIHYPNFAAFDPTGNLYVSNSGADFDTASGEVYRIAPDGTTSLFAAGFRLTNGIAFNATGSALYVIESRGEDILRVAVNPDGTAGDRAVFCEGLVGPPDGMAFDAAGNLYVTLVRNHKVARVDPSGQVSDFLTGDGTLLAKPTNCAFAGRDLLIAGLTQPWLVRVRGVGRGLPLYHQV
jgi:sugar lactone lactonase YvrE